MKMDPVSRIQDANMLCVFEPVQMDGDYCSGDIVSGGDPVDPSFRSV